MTPGSGRPTPVVVSAVKKWVAGLDKNDSEFDRLRCEALWVLQGHHAVDESSYLVLNHGQTYSINIESRQPVESFCLFFAEGFAEDVQRTLSRPPEDATVPWAKP
jgi:hypothetical protein